MDLDSICGMTDDYACNARCRTRNKILEEARSCHRTRAPRLLVSSQFVAPRPYT